MRWEQRMASTLGIEDPDAPKSWDYPVWVITGVFNTRREIFS